MKKIIMLLAAVCAFASCDPVSEDISNGGHITAEELKSQSTVTLDGNVVTCNTSAPVNAKWTIAGKDLIGNYAWKKLKLGDQTITLTGICADGTELTADFPVSVTTIDHSSAIATPIFDKESKLLYTLGKGENTIHYNGALVKANDTILRFIV